MKFGLNDKTFLNIVKVLKNDDIIEKIILFGSRALGTYRNGSDIDICLKGNALNLNTILKLSVELDNLELPYEFDIIIYTQITEPLLKEHIDTYGVEL